MQKSSSERRNPPAITRVLRRGLTLAVAAILLGSCIFGVSTVTIDLAARVASGYYTIARALGAAPVEIFGMSVLGLLCSALPGCLGGLALSLILRAQVQQGRLHVPSWLIGLLGGLATGLATAGLVYLMLGPQPGFADIDVPRDQYVVYLLHPPIVGSLIGVLYARWLTDWLRRSSG